MDNLISKKRGRPKLPYGTVPVLRRMPEDLIAKVDGLIGAEIDKRHRGNLKAVDEWLLREYGFVKSADSAPMWINKPFTDENLKALEPHVEKSLNQSPSIKALLDDVERLEKEKLELQELNRKIARMSDDEKFKVLLSKFDKLRASLPDRDGINQT